MKATTDNSRVRVLLPLLEDSGNGMQVDQTEQVILNGEITTIKRGEYVDVKPEVFCQLRVRYPNL